MKKILKHLKKEWYRYGLETLVVIVGIMVAFSLGNWNENRLEGIEEKNILLNLRQDIDNTIDEFHFLNSLRESVIMATYRIYEVSSEYPMYSKSELDSLFGITLLQPTYNGQMGSLELLFSTGKINLISNEDLKSKLISWPGIIDDMKEEEVYANDIYKGGYYNMLSKYAVMPDIINRSDSTSLISRQMITQEFTINKEVMVSEYDKLLISKPFLNHLAARLIHFEVSYAETMSLIDQATELGKQIDRELDKK